MMARRSMASWSLRRRVIATLAAATVASSAAPAAAVDGVTQINQARALAGGVTPGDGAGFPVTISASGGYRLTSDLTVPDENASAVSITADSVTLDLNGFSIAGSGVRWKTTTGSGGSTIERSGAIPGRVTARCSTGPAR